MSAAAGGSVWLPPKNCFSPLAGLEAVSGGGPCPAELSRGPARPSSVTRQVEGSSVVTKWATSASAGDVGRFSGTDELAGSGELQAPVGQCDGFSWTRNLISTRALAAYRPQVVRDASAGRAWLRGDSAVRRTDQSALALSPKAACHGPSSFVALRLKDVPIHIRRDANGRMPQDVGHHLKRYSLGEHKTGG